MRKGLLAVLAMLVAVVTVACASPVPPTTTPLAATAGAPAATPSAVPSELPPTPMPTEVPPAPSPESLEAFESLLIEALRARDENLLATLMADPFAIGLWRSEGYSLPAAEAAEHLLAEYLPSGGELALDKPSRESLSGMLSGTDPYTIWGPEATIVSVLSGTGWGGDGNMRAFLAIGERPGGYCWYGLLVGKERLFEGTGG